MTERVRTYWRGLVIAAAVSLRQIGDLPVGGELREKYPYVLLQETPQSNGFVPAERVGPYILTEPSDSTISWSPN